MAFVNSVKITLFLQRQRAIDFSLSRGFRDAKVTQTFIRAHSMKYPARSGKTSGISSHCVFGTPPGVCEFSLSPGRANGYRTLFSAKCLRKPKEIRGGVKITHFCIDLPPATISSHFCSDRWNAWPAPNFNENFGFLGENFLLHRIDAFEICGKITCMFHYISDMLAQCCPSQ